MLLLVRVGVIFVVAVQKATGSPYGDEDFARLTIDFFSATRTIYRETADCSPLSVVTLQPDRAEFFLFFFALLF